MYDKIREGNCFCRPVHSNIILQIKNSQLFLYLLPTVASIFRYCILLPSYLVVVSQVWGLVINFYAYISGRGLVPNQLVPNQLVTNFIIASYILLLHLVFVVAFQVEIIRGLVINFLYIVDVSIGPIPFIVASRFRYCILYSQSFLFITAYVFYYCN